MYKPRFVRLFTAGICAAAITAAGVPVATALTPGEYTIMMDDFERTYGKNYVALGAQKSRNRCIVPDEQQKILNPPLYDMQTKERLACETQMTRLVDSVRTDSAWSPAMDAALTTLGTDYKFIPAIQLRQSRRDTHIDAWRQQPWSEKLEVSLGYLADRDNTAKFVLDLARKVNRTRVENSVWSPTVENVLAPMLKYDSEAETMLKAKRRTLLSEWAGKSWSPLMETVIGPMSNDFDNAEARKLLSDARKDVLRRWVDEPYSDAMNTQLGNLAEFYPTARTLLEDKKREADTGQPAPERSYDGVDAVTPPAPVTEPDKTETTAQPAPQPAPQEAPSGGESSGGSIGGIIAAVIALLGIGGTALYFAWFGI
ncbi:MAG: hypothetical protein SOW59_08505 [Corynebacterium sp.]|nr:hypothetical protein [Corynebacterium sp.]